MLSNFPDYDISSLVKKIPDVYILDSDFSILDIVDDYTSLIWTRRYYETGDFELYVNASEKNRELIKLGRYVKRFDDEEIFRIETYEIATSVDGGDFITASGRDLRSILYQRCIPFSWIYCKTNDTNFNLETIVRQIVQANFIDAGKLQSVYDTIEMVTEDDEQIDISVLKMYNDSRRNIPHFALGEKWGFTKTLAYLEVDSGNVGDWLEEICQSYNWGWRVRYDKESDDYLKFELYDGTDRTKTVAFSEEFENLLDTSYKEDRSEYVNSYIVNDDDTRISAIFSTTEGLDRYESIADTDINGDVATSLTFEELVEAYGWAEDGGNVNYYYEMIQTGIFNSDLVYKGVTIWLENFKVPLFNEPNWTSQVKSAFSNGYETTINSIKYWVITDKILCCEDETFHPGSWWQNTKKIKTGLTQEPEEGRNTYWSPSSSVPVPDIVQQAIAMTNAYASLELYTKDTEFSGTIDPFATYSYREDYYLGDLVTVKTKYGYKINARITEAMETFDTNGATLEVSFTSESEQE